MINVLFDFADPNTADVWHAIDDRVMGGVSRSRLRGAASEHAVFEALAERGGVHVIHDTVAQVLSDEALKSDAIHPNRDGYARMAAAAQQVLARCPA